jgi:hypothetical protein
MGAAGDMLMSALLDIHPAPEEFIERLNNIGIPNVEIEKKIVNKCGINGVGISVKIDGHEEEYIHEHSHEHIHEHTHEHSHEHIQHQHEHHHTGMGEIEEIIANLNVSNKIKNDILSVYNLIAESESHAHGKPVEQIHFHEVGSMDAVADIAGVCMLIDEINPDKIYTSPIHVGCGQVKCAHGLLPVPAPATEFILRGVPTYGGEIKGELCTPTGAALLKYFTDEFVSTNSMTVDKTGYGMGKRHFYTKDGTEILSAVRVMIGEQNGEKDEIIMLSCNIDDMTGEQIGFATERLLESGALEVYTTPVYMKKNRPGIQLNVMCTEGNKKNTVEKIFKYTSTIGIRELSAKRYILKREEDITSTKFGDVRVKKSSGYGVSKIKAEYEDLKKLAVENDIGISDIKLDI